MADSPLTCERNAFIVADERYGFARREAVYRFAGHHGDARRVLDMMDVGCGEGYGSALLAQRAAWVLGVSLDGAVVARAAHDYPAVRYEVMTPDGLLPCDDACVDVVLCRDLSSPLFATDRLLAEFFRVLRPGGQLVCTVPNRRAIANGRAGASALESLGIPPAEDPLELIAPRFKVDTLLGLHHGWRLVGLERLLGCSLPDLLDAEPPPLWPRWVRSAVHRVHPSDFSLRADRIDEALELIALATRR